MNPPLPSLRTGAGHLGVSLVEGLSSVTASGATDPLKLLVTTPRGRCAWAFTTTYGGGLLAGDRIDLRVDVAAGTSLYLGTQASTKIYRSPEGLAAEQRLRLTAGPGSVVVGLPDPVTPFATAVHLQDQELELAASASLVWLDGVTSGRAARDERWQCTRHRSALRLRVDGRLRFVDCLDLERGAAPLSVRMAEYGALATVLMGGPAFAALAERIVSEVAQSPLPASGSPLLLTAAPIPGWGAVVRLAAAERETLDRQVRRLLGDVRPFIADDPWERRP
jgi:urease accessory protein